MVVMDKEVYIREAMRQLRDQEVYTSLDEDPTRNMVEEINARIRECYDKGTLTRERGITLWRMKNRSLGGSISYRRYISQDVRGDRLCRDVIPLWKGSPSLWILL